MNYASDNVTGCCPEIMAALAEAATGAATPYGDDDWTAHTEDVLRAVFDKADLKAFLVSTGTAANSLAIASLCPPWGGVICHTDGHIAVDECNAPAVLSGGAKMLAIPGPNGKLTPEAVTAEALASRGRDVHRVQAAVVYISQSNEAGCVYTPDEVAALSEVCRAHNLKLMMDGARFANAYVALRDRGLVSSPAEATWKLGVDVLTFGATKNGAWASEAVIFFDPALAESFVFHRKRTGHLLSKGRFLGVQMAAYLKDDLWCRNARHANAMARRLHDGLTAVPGVSSHTPLEANEVFLCLPEVVRRALSKAEITFLPWDDADPSIVRLVCGYDTRAEDIDVVIEVARKGIEEEVAAKTWAPSSPLLDLRHDPA